MTEIINVSKKGEPITFNGVPGAAPAATEQPTPYGKKPVNQLTNLGVTETTYVKPKTH